MKHRLLPIALNQFSTLAFGLVGVKLISTFVPPAANGSYALFLTLTQLSVMLTHSGLINHASRYWQREVPHAGGYVRFLVQVALELAACLAPFLITAGLALAFWTGDLGWQWSIVPLLIGNLATALYALGANVLTASGNLWWVCLLGVVSNAGRILLPVGLVLAVGASLASLAGGFALSSVLLIICLVAAFGWARKSPRPESSSQSLWRRELREYGRPFMLLGVGTWLLNCADRWLVAAFFGGDRAGLFAFASGIGAIAPMLVAGVLMQLSFPSVFRAADSAQSDADWRRIARSCDQLTLAFVLLTAAGLFSIWWICPYLVGNLISSDYTGAVAVVLPAGWAVVATQINQFQYLLLQGRQNSWAMVKVMLVVAGIKTLGGVLAASISWEAFLWWLILSAVLGGVVGRQMIHGLALFEPARGQAGKGVA